MTPMCQNACRASGIDVFESVQLANGDMLTKGQVAEAFDRSYQAIKNNMIVQCGGDAKHVRKRQKEFRSRVKDDVGRQLNMSIPDNAFFLIACGIALFVLGGPITFVVSVVAVLFEWMLENDLPQE